LFQSDYVNFRLHRHDALLGTLPTQQNLRRPLHGPTSYTVHPVVDLTGISGGWDFSTGWTPLVQLRPENAAGMTLFEAVEKMPGLKLEQQTRAIPVTVIDHVDLKLKQ